MKPPERLIQAIAQDLRPVRPSPPPLPLALRMVPLALLFSWLIFLAMGVRQDSPMLGPLLTWGTSSAQFLLAIALVWVAVREGNPSGRLPRHVVHGATAGALIGVVTITLITSSLSPPGRLARFSPWIGGLACGMGSTIAGAILVLLFGWIFRKSVAARTPLTGALFGAAAGVAVNSDWRIACPVSTLGHTLGAHGAAIVATTLLGAVLGRVWGSRR